MGRTVCTYVEVGIDEFEDEELIAECQRRGLTVGLTPAHPDDEPDPIDLPKEASEIQRDLMTRWHQRAADGMQALLARIVPPQLLAAADAIREGRYADAICELDRLIEPSPAATATSLPKRADSAGAST